jgi:crossover junction endodeoxyribonuclease RuvC
MIIIGIDPSLVSTGWAIVESKRKGKYKLIDYGTIKVNTKVSLIGRIDDICDAVFVAISTNDNIECAAVEEPFVGKNMKTSLQLAKLHGALLRTLSLMSSVEIETYSPSYVKQAVTGSGNASKDAVIQAVKKKVGYKGNQTDEADAIAIALTCINE